MPEWDSRVRVRMPSVSVYRSNSIGRRSAGAILSYAPVVFYVRAPPAATVFAVLFINSERRSQL